jgi:hypothetical protein
MKDTATLYGFLKPFAAREMRCYPVSSRVNQAQCDDPECAAPIKLESPPQGQLFV